MIDGFSAVGILVGATGFGLRPLLPV